MGLLYLKRFKGDSKKTERKGEAAPGKKGKGGGGNESHHNAGEEGKRGPSIETGYWENRVMMGCYGLNYVPLPPPNSHVEVLTPTTSECD